VSEHIKGAGSHSNARVEWSEWSERIQRERESRRSEEWVWESSKSTEREGIVEGIFMTKNRVEEFKRVGKSEDTGVEWMASGVGLGVAGWMFGRGWPDTMAVVRLAFLRVNQDLIGVVELTVV